MPTIEISQFAFEYLKSVAVPLVDTTVSVFDRIVQEHGGQLNSAKKPEIGMEMHFGPANLPSVKFTTISAATVSGKPVGQKYWNNILEDMISACSALGAKSSDLKDALAANLMDGDHNENGYRYVQAAGFSFQGLEANRACKNIVSLAVKFKVPVEIMVHWPDNESVKYPNTTARLIFP